MDVGIPARTSRGPCVLSQSSRENSLLAMAVLEGVNTPQSYWRHLMLQSASQHSNKLGPSGVILSPSRSYRLERCIRSRSKDT
jgi:hypothetical protein